MWEGRTKGPRAQPGDGGGIIRDADAYKVTAV